jgi:hypothetical protein
LYLARRIVDVSVVDVLGYPLIAFLASIFVAFGLRSFVSDFWGWLLSGGLIFTIFFITMALIDRTFVPEAIDYLRVAVR